MCIFSNGGYPLGADEDPKAPWNEKEPEQIKVKVCVSVTYSKSVEVVVPENYEYSNLIEAVENMRILPNDIIKECRERIFKNNVITTAKAFPLLDFSTICDIARKDAENYELWHEDELEVVEDRFIPHNDQ